MSTSDAPTGGGVEMDGMDQTPLSWDEFSRDLRLARCSCDDIHVFSLEGCVKQGFIKPLLDFDWDSHVRKPKLLTYFFSIARIVSFSVSLLKSHPFFTGFMSGFLMA